MRNAHAWSLIAAAVAVGILANWVSMTWARGSQRYSPAFFGMLALAPLVFISFGLVSSRLGLAVGSGVIDSLLTLGTIAVGLVFFQEWRTISAPQYLGMALAFAGVLLMLT